MYDGLILIGSILLPVILVAGIVFYLIKRSMSANAARAADASSGNDRSIDLSSLDVKPRPQLGPRLRIFGIDSTMAVLVLAPRGNSVSFPAAEELHSMVDRIVPGFSRVLDTHQPLFRRWEPQMSFEGFTHSFAYNLALPGDKGQGTPWSSACGKMTVKDGQLFVGIVFYSDHPSEVGQIVVEHEGKWNDFVQVT